MELPKFFLAIDESDIEGAFDAIAKIRGVKGDYGIKINLDLILKYPNVISKVWVYSGKPVFADLKMWNGKRTMREIIETVAGDGGAMVNAYALADSMLDEAVNLAKKRELVILGVTVLTHYNEDYCQKFHRMSMADLVRLLAQTSLKYGCDGYILPGTCLGAVSDLSGIKFNPAVRPAWFKEKKANAQEQIMEPGQAIEGGANIVSCRSPVFKSADPAEALSRILEEIQTAKI